MTAAEIVAELKQLGQESIKKVLLKHGICEPLFGVKIESMKPIQKRIKKDYQLALDLYDTGIYDAQYLAGLIADDARMTKADLRRWAKTANCDALCGSVVAWVAAEGQHGWDMAREWIESKSPTVAVTGWSTFGGLVSITDDADLDMAELKHLLKRVEKTIHQQPDRVRYAMNGFVIGVGCYVSSLTELAIKTAQAVGKVQVDMGETACKVPYAPDYIQKVRDRGTLGKKRKTVKC